ncbi:MAG: response regulator [Chitinophagales bacterium]
METKAINILLADDDDGDRLLFKEAIGELKIKSVVHTVNDGNQLMDYLKKGGNPLPQLIFLDLNMPQKNGLECLVEIRSDKKLKDIAIAIFSTSASEKDIDATFINGANVYIQKPNSFIVLKEVLSKAISTAHLYQHPPFNKDNFLLRV